MIVLVHDGKEREGFQTEKQAIYVIIDFNNKYYNIITDFDISIKRIRRRFCIYKFYF